MRVLLRQLCFLLCAVAVTALAAPATAQDDELVAEFKRYFRKYKDTPTRVEAVLSLQGTETGDVVGVLAPLLSEGEPEVVQAAVRVLSGFKTRVPVDSLLAELASASDSAVRAGLLEALSRGRYPGTQAGVLPCLQDSAWQVRRRALQALAVSADPTVAPAIVPLCQETEVAVRCSALDALAALHSDLVLGPARADLANSSWQVRASAIAALARVRHVDSIGPLIERLALEEGRLVEDIGRALAEITGRDFGSRVDAWQQFWKSVEGRFQIPSDEELAKLHAVQAERKEQYQGRPGVTNYHGIETPSQSIVFVIDVSGSMEQEVVDKERYAGRQYASWQRIEIVKDELIRTVQALDPAVQFNVLAFATEVRSWKKAPVKANPVNRSSAETWISHLEALGGASKEDLARVGLTGSANLEAGKTNTYDALMSALGVIEGNVERGYKTNIDTIFFLSDGRPSHGRFVEPDDILREVRAANELRRTVIHTLAIGEFEKDFMRQLAEQNGGTFVDLGH